METYPHVKQPDLKVLGEGYEMKGNWKKEFFKNDNPLVLELGCGKGEYTVALAKEFPDKNFIGIDIKGARIWAGANQALEDKFNWIDSLDIVIYTREFGNWLNNKAYK